MFDTRLATKDTGDLAEGSNLYYTTVRVNSDFDTRLATKDTGDLAEGVNLYYTDARFDTRLATKDTDDLTEGTNLYYTQARFDSAFANKTTSSLTEGTNLYYTDARANSAIDTRVTKSFVDNLGVIAGSVQADSVALGTDTTGNYIQTITGTANKITVTGSGSESADVTLTLPDDVQIADSLTVAGNLTVNGTLTSLDTTNLDIEDNLFQLNAGLTGSPVNDSGMLINRGDQDNGIFMWDESVDKFTLGLTTADGTSTGNITLNSLGTLVANIEGDVTGDLTGTIQTAAQPNITSVGTLTGLDVTGTVTADGLDVSTLSGDATIFLQNVSSARGMKITKNYDDFSAKFFYSLHPTTEAGSLAFKGSQDSTQLLINSNGDISFYEDTGTTAQMTWDASADALTFTDNTKAIFGTGSDLEIFHTGLGSYIIESGTGNLFIRGTNLLLEDADGNDYIAMTDTGTGGTVEIKHNASTKLATTATGIDVNGTATMDGLTVDQSGVGATTASFNHFHANADWISFDWYGTNLGSITQVGGADLELSSAYNMTLTTSSNDRLKIASNGDISFYDDTGTSQALFWDASAESLGIGTTSPSEELHIETTGGATAGIQLSTTGGTVDRDWKFLATAAAGTFFIQDATASVNRVAIDTSGNVGIGTTTPSELLHLKTEGTQLLIEDTSSGNKGSLFAANTATVISSDPDNAVANSVLQFQVDGSEAMRIDSSGNVGIGTTSPNQLLEVKGTSGTAAARIHADTITSPRAELEFMRGTTDTFGGDTYTDWKIGTVGATQADFAIISSDTTRGSNERLTIEYDTGNVGIGTTSPQGDRLSVVGSDLNNDDDLITLGGAFTASTEFFASIGTHHIDVNNGGIKFSTKQSGTVAERLRIDASGNVGIGTTSPAYKLDVAKSDNTVVNVGITNANTGTSAQTRLRLNNSGSNFGTITHTGGSFTTSGVYRQDGTYVYGNGAGGLSLITGASQPIYFATNNSERMRIDSSGVLRLGTISGQTNAKLTIRQNSNDIEFGHGNITSGYYGTLGASHTNGLPFVALSAEADSSGNTFTTRGIKGNIIQNAADGSLTFSQATTASASGQTPAERMRIDSSGNVGIGVTDPDVKLEVSGSARFAQENHSWTFDDINNSRLGFVKKSLNYPVLASASGSPIIFSTSNNSNLSSSVASQTLTERMRIDSSGNLLVSTTDTAPATNNVAGIALRNEGHINVSRSSGVVGYFNRITNDGTILDFLKDGTSVGSIGTKVGGLTIGNGDTALRMQDSINSIYPFNITADSNRDGAIDLGTSAVRFKDLYLSGGAYLGGAAAANKLDDYEEGTWTPAVSGMSYTVQTGKYTKVGDLVFIKFRIAWNALSGTTNVVTGLPFAADSDNESMAFSVYVNAGFGSIPSGKGYLNAYVSSSGTNLLFTWQPTTQTANFTTSGNIYVAGTYLT
jgi:hypothetical protein